MVQQLGETVDAVMEADNKAVEAILNANPSGRYWILIAYKPQSIVSGPRGEHVVKRLVKAYKKKPIDLVGTVRLEVLDGEIVQTDVFMPDRPIDWESIQGYAGLDERPLVQHAPGVGRTYMYDESK